MFTKNYFLNSHKMSIRLSINVRIYAGDAMERKDGDEDQCLSPNFINMILKSI